MVPLYFGSKQRRLFGIHEPAYAQVGPPRAVLLCHAWGSEYLNSYRSMRFVADQLVAAGFHVMRFDYYGSGDSGGETTEADLRAGGTTSSPQRRNCKRCPTRDPSS